MTSIFLTDVLQLPKVHFPDFEFLSSAPSLLSHLVSLSLTNSFLAKIVSEEPFFASVESVSATVECQEKRLGTTIFPTISLLNHSCQPNATIAYEVGTEGVVGIVSACRDIQPGEEIAISYVSSS